MRDGEGGRKGSCHWWTSDWLLYYSQDALLGLACLYVCTYVYAIRQIGSGRGTTVSYIVSSIYNNNIVSYK